MHRTSNLRASGYMFDNIIGFRDPDALFSWLQLPSIVAFVVVGLSGLETGGSGGSMNRGSRAPEGPELQLLEK